MTAQALQLSAWCAAFWTALALYRGARPLRFAAGLGLGAACAHAGWALLHLDAVRAHPQALLKPVAGASVLFVPLGLVALERSAAAFAALPLSLAVARLGCLAAGCCHGQAGEPTPLAESAGWVVLHLAVRRLPGVRVAPAVLAGFGLLRLALEPWRAAPPLGPPALPASILALAWIAAASIVAGRPFGGRLRAARG